MLKQIFQTAPLFYYQNGQNPIATAFPGIHYDSAPDPYAETLQSPVGLFVSRVPTLKSPTSIYLLGNLNANYWPSWATAMWRFDGVSGELITRFALPSTLGILLSIINSVQSRSGRLYALNYYSTTLTEFILSDYAKVFSDQDEDEVPIDQGFEFGQELAATFFEDVSFFTGAMALDDLTGVFLMSPSSGLLKVYSTVTGLLLYSIQFPDSIVQIALEDESKAYILLGNRVLILFEYARGEVLGAVKLPSVVNATYWNNSDIVISWDFVFRRLLVCERVDDNPDGSPNTVVRGYRTVPLPVRLTQPIALRAARQGRIIPVLSQVVGDMNEGVGGNLVLSLVSGSGSLVGIPMTDHNGNGITLVACEGSDQFVPSPPDEDFLSTGSPDGVPPSVGEVNVESWVKIWQPDPKDLPVIGVQPVPGGGGSGGGPGSPSAGAEAPNMMYIMQQVYASQLWRLTEAYEDEPDGRGVFTERVVTAMHDVDARWGHIDKNPGQNQYNGHAVDAIIFKNDDGVTAEIYDIVNGGSGALMWNFIDRTTANRPKWYYPA